MKITEAKFLKSVYKLAHLPNDHKPEIAFSGRSNVGKSTLINTLLNRKGIAKTSSTPGRTQAINFITVNDSFFFVDLPGYGYAKVPASVKKHWQHLIEGYLEDRPPLRLVILIIDSRRDPRDDEAAFVEWLDLHGIQSLIVLTKADKLKKNMKKKSFDTWRRFLDRDAIVLFSSMTGEGKDSIWKTITRYVSKKNIPTAEQQIT